MSIINYESPLLTVTKVNGDYQATVQADSAYLISSIESTTQTPSEGAQWTQLESHGEGGDTGILNSGKYETIRPILTVNDSNVNYRIKTTPISYVVNLHRNHSNDDSVVIQKYIDHSTRQLNRGDITVDDHTYTFMQDNAVIQFPSQQWSFPSGFNTFEGWNTEPDGSGEYISDCSTVGMDTDLYAIYGFILNPPSIRYEPNTFQKFFELMSNNAGLGGESLFYMYEIPGYEHSGEIFYYENHSVELPHSGPDIQPDDLIYIWSEYNGQISERLRIYLSDITDDYYPRY